MKEAKALFIQDLTIKAGRHLLLDKANLTIQPQELVLLVGPSGCGKSIFLKFLSGLISSDTHGFSISGEVEIFGKSLQVERKKALAKVGIVFQEHSLFDEFSPLQNIQFAMDHSAYFWTKEERNKFFEQVKTNLALDPKTPVIHYSGGQKKRLALARTLAYHPEILIYDEPTAGLDPKNAKEVASLIGKTHHTYQKTTIVVTHEYRYLLPIAHQVIFFNPETKKLERIEKDEIEEKMAHAASPSPSQSLSLLRKVWESPKNTTLSLLETTGRFGVLALSSLYFLFPIWKRFKWGLRYLAYYFRLLFSFSAFLYLALAGAIVGFVVTYFTFQFLPYRSYNEPLLIDDILAALGFSLYRIFIPIIASILIAARGTAAITADIGNRLYNRQIDAMKSFDVYPESYLYTNILYAFLVSTPLLTIFSFFVAKYASMMVFTYTHPQHSAYFWDVNFHYLLHHQQSTFFYAGTGWVIAKMVSSGALLSVISYMYGMKPKTSGRDISKNITQAIIMATLGVLAIHFLFALVEFQNISPQ